LTVPTAPDQVPPEIGAPETDRDRPATDGSARQNQIKLRLEVVAGAHRGAVLLLDESDYRIGRSPDADIVLSDSGVAPAHAMLHVGRDMLTGRTMVRIAATGGDIMVGQEKLPRSRGCRAKLPVSIGLGETRVDLSDAGAGGVAPADIRKTLTAVGVAAGAAFAIAVATLAFRASGSADVRAPERLTSGQPAGLSTANVSSAFALAAEEAERALNARLDAAKITTLRISAENGRLAATGTLAGQQASEWAAIQRWFDQTYNGRIVLTTRIDRPGGPRAMPALQLQAVWYGDRPYILTADGEHYFTGAVLDNGWIIRDIGEDRLLLAKEGETVALTYRLSSPQATAPQAARTNE
jgi:hypothetical protein